MNIKDRINRSIKMCPNTSAELSITFFDYEFDESENPETIADAWRRKGETITVERKDGKTTFIFHPRMK